MAFDTNKATALADAFEALVTDMSTETDPVVMGADFSALMRTMLCYVNAAEYKGNARSIELISPPYGVTADADNAAYAACVADALTKLGLGG